VSVVLVALDVWSGVGGIQRYCGRVARALGELAASRGGRVRVVALRDTPDDARMAPPPVEAVGGSRRRLRTLGAFQAALRELRPDTVVYAHVLLAPLVILGRLLAPRAKHLLLVYGFEVWGDPAFRPAPWWERRLVAWGFDGLVTISDYTAARMRAAYGVPAAAFVKLVPAVEDAGPGAGDGGEGATVLTVARLRPEERTKGVDALIRALPRLARVVPAARLTIVGDGPQRPELEALARDLGVADRVELAGRVSDEDLDRAYATANVFALPSSQEGFGIVYLEAWRHGLPVVAGDADAGAEVVESGVSGLLVPAGDAGALADALAELLGDPGRSRRMGKAGRASLGERYLHDRFRETLASILDGGRPNP